MDWDKFAYEFKSVFVFVYAQFMDSGANYNGDSSPSTYAIAVLARFVYKIRRCAEWLIACRAGENVFTW